MSVPDQREKLAQPTTQGEIPPSVKGLESFRKM